MRAPVCCLAAAVGLAACTGAPPAAVDPQVAAHLDSIRAIDNHAHVFAPDVADDKDYDALRCEPLPSTPGLVPANVRFGPDTAAAWKALYGVTPSSSAEADQKVNERHAALRKEHGDGYYDWVLDEAHVDVVLANRVAMTPGLKAPRFRWVSYADALIFPLDNSQLAAANPDRKALFAMEDDLFRRYLNDLQLAERPATLEAYLADVVRQTLSRQRAAGALAIKLEAAYLRRLDFEPATAEAASAIYKRYVRATPPAADYKTLQDYLFHEVASEAGRLGLVVQIHTGAGCGESFDVPGSDPMLLTAAFNDPTLRQTTFVILHGGSPFERHVAPLIAKPNVYGDTSVLELMLSSSELARVLRPWLETMPEHVMYGTDADFFGPGMTWIETNWLGSRKARQALGLALTAMMRDGVIDLARAKELAELVLRQNAARLYHLS